MRAVGLAVALIAASGAVISPFALTQLETVTIDRWQQPLSTPTVLLAPRLATGDQQAIAFVEAAPFGSQIFPGHWLRPLAEPVRIPPRLATENQQFRAFVEAAPFPETVSIDRWLVSLSEPVRVPPRLVTGDQQALAFVEATFVETVSIDRWLRPLSEPVRLPPRLVTGAQQATAFGAAAPYTESVTLDRWQLPLSEPVRIPPRLGTGDQQSLALVEAKFLETVSIDRWLRPLSEPVRLPRALLPGQQQSLGLVEAAPFNERLTLDKWFSPLSLPVRLPPRLIAGAQQSLALVRGGQFAEPVTLDRWHIALSEPVRLPRSLLPGQQQSLILAEAIFAPVPVETLVQRLEVDDYVALFDLDATSLGGGHYRFTSSAFGTAPIVWNGNTYGPTPIEVSGFEYNGRGPLPAPVIRVANVSLAFSAAAIAFHDLLGATLTRTRTFRRYLDGQSEADPTRHFPLDVYRIDRKRQQNKSFIEWELAAVIDQGGVTLPRRPILRNACTHRYRTWTGTAFDYTNATCPYAGTAYFDENGVRTDDPAQDSCGKRLSDCKKRFGRAPLPTRAFPGVARS